jgi:hypothetical protein
MREIKELAEKSNERGQTSGKIVEEILKSTEGLLKVEKKLYLETEALFILPEAMKTTIKRMDIPQKAKDLLTKEETLEQLVKTFHLERLSLGSSENGLFEILSRNSGKKSEIRLNYAKLLEMAMAKVKGDKGPCVNSKRSGSPSLCPASSFLKISIIFLRPSAKECLLLYSDHSPSLL